MPHLLVMHGVEEFDRWFSVFQSQEDAHEGYGMKLEMLMRDIDKPNVEVFMFEVDSIAGAQEFMNRPGTEKIAELAGVTGEPLIMFLDTIK